MGAFHAYDIRGVYGKDFNSEDVYRMGFFLPSVLNAKRWLVGRDIRESSPEIYSFLLKGLIDAGAIVSDAGLCTTPMIYWATAKYGFDARDTASHIRRIQRIENFSGKCCPGRLRQRTKCLEQK